MSARVPWRIISKHVGNNGINGSRSWPWARAWLTAPVRRHGPADRVLYRWHVGVPHYRGDVLRCVVLHLYVVSMELSDGLLHRSRALGREDGCI